jgi:MYXO-CTERM domain-containing protein
VARPDAGPIVSKADTGHDDEQPVHQIVGCGCSSSSDSASGWLALMAALGAMILPLRRSSVRARR